ncbi:MAG: uroporphyrinogen-III synthase [Bacteroidales bacterium]|jgi:uroporphyrinogen-III synthase|nr:uroporphyrinogen-III synthase [Bacteroidales bacterium]NCU35104.1 uroporphyrinogen-III synthase [Candidatus Falkowbacteria bacterium]MDD2632604.1 uroporphyrinogen-III synthase [Bacteroidales bacterium]MDD3130481.1 uroporphyrinogen-III synthase [Bacteroidales bacterium]MDD3526855.1 uroporphyrinogen-III synthase [Bacteroidales bacterium]
MVKNILVSQPKPADPARNPYNELAEKYELNIDFHKFIKVEGIPGRVFRKDKVSILDHSAVIFTSRNSVDHFFRICNEMRVEVPDEMKYFSISESTSYYLQKYVQFRKRKVFHGHQNFNDLMDIIKKHKDEKFLLPCSDIHKLSLTKALDDNKIKYSKAIIYRTLASDLSKLNIHSYDMIIFFSPSGVKSLQKNFPNYEQGDTKIGVFGPTTAKAVKEAGFTLNLNAPTKSAPSMTMALDQYIEKLYKKNGIKVGM